MKYKQISIKEAADRCRNGEAVYAARCIDGMSFREVAEATMLLVIEVPVPEMDPVPEKAKKKSPPTTKKTIDRGKVKALHEAGWSNAKIADEMKCSAWSVSMILKEFREQEEKQSEVNADE